MSEFVFPGTTVILAGGLGSRVAGRYPDLPKPLIEAAGRPFLYWVTLWLADAGARDIVYATGHLGDMIESWAAAPDLPRNIRRRCHREDRPLGTVGAVAACLDLCARIKARVAEFVYLEAPVGEDPDKRDYLVSNARVEATGFDPDWSLDAGIAELVKGYRMLRNTRFGNV